ncbi:MAG: hypothetical protein JWO57_1867 [Pseudonocardiales bacterium]|nr:hypothetical protein [Pseudonocardiales bacterium]
MKRSSTRGALLAGIAATLLASSGLASAAAARPAAVPADSSAIVRGAHFSPDTPGVDVYLTAFAGGTTSLWLSGVGYGDVSPYQRLAPGAYTVAMRAHNAPASTPAALSWVLNARSGQAYTAAAVGMNKQLHGIILRDELTPPGTGTGLVRVIQAASRAPQATVTALHGPVIAKNAAFATSTAYATVPAGNWPIRASSLTTPSVATSSDLRIHSGTVTSIVLLDGKPTGIAIRTVVDAAGAAIAPIGAIPAGGGGTAPRPGPAWAGAALLLGGIALAGTVGIARRRTRMPTAR